MKKIGILLLLIQFARFMELQGQNQVILRNLSIHCQRGLLNCEKCQATYGYKYMLLKLDIASEEALPMVYYKGGLHTYHVEKVFLDIEDTKRYAASYQIPIEVSPIDTDATLKQISQKVQEVGWHITWDEEEKQIIVINSVPVKEIETGKKVLPMIIIEHKEGAGEPYFEAAGQKFNHMTYKGFHEKMNPVEEKPGENNLEKIRSFQNFIWNLKN